jgi:hypothetical protein
MAQLSRPVEPFGEVNVHRRPDGRLGVTATILKVPDVEGARTGLALDASASMKQMYGLSGLIGGPFAKAAGVPNVVEPVARTMAAFLANFSATGRADLVYWAVAPDGSQVEPIGSFDEAAAATAVITGPRKYVWGRGTKLLPPLRYFTESAFAAAPWAICVFVTDGRIEDLSEVKAYSRRLADDIAAGRRRFIKLVLLGVGTEVDIRQMEELDDMFDDSGLKDPDGHDIDLWDHKLATEMTRLEEIFAEVVTEDTIVSPTGRVVDQWGRLVRDWPDGLPARLRFELPGASTWFTLELLTGSVTQDIGEAIGRL